MIHIAKSVGRDLLGGDVPEYVTMRYSGLEPSEIAVLLDAEEQVFDQLAKEHVVSDQVRAKITDIVHKIGLQKVKGGTPLDAADLALDALITLMSVRAPAN
jgi:hypothetical protein